MLWKFLLTAVVLVFGYLTLTARWRGPLPTRAPAVAAPPRRWVRQIAWGVLAVMILGCGWYLWRDWEYANRVLEVQVVNAATGAVTPYRARRKDIDGRIVRTLDGREIRLADVERMVLVERPPGD